MELLKKNWVRIITSLIGGGIINELIHVTTGDPNRLMETNLSLLFAIIFYGILSFAVKKSI